jgi:hypothetical protein
MVVLEPIQPADHEGFQGFEAEMGPRSAWSFGDLPDRACKLLESLIVARSAWSPPKGGI